MRTTRITVLSVCLVLALAATAMSLVTLESFDPIPGDPDLALGTYQHPAGGPTFELTEGIGSGAYRGPFDFFPSSIWGLLERRHSVVDAFWTVSDRGANFQCDEVGIVLPPLTPATACPARTDPPAVDAGVGRIYPLPDYSPTIFRVHLLRDGTFRIATKIPLQTKSGLPVLGLPNPLTVATTEVPRDGTGAVMLTPDGVIARDASAMDAEAIVFVPIFGGRFFIAEENAPSIVEVTHNGRVLRRSVPAGTEGDFTAPLDLSPADYTIEGSLPGILAKRRLNRGLESLAISPDFKYLYALMQSPLDNPTSAGAIRDSGRLRLLKLRIRWHRNGSSLEPVGEWVYLLDPVSTFTGVGDTTENSGRRDLRVSEMLRVGHERFLIIERTDLTTILFQVDLATGTNILGSSYDDLATTPSLEQVADLSAPTAEFPTGIQTLVKTQRLIASSSPARRCSRKSSKLSSSGVPAVSGSSTIPISASLARSPGSTWSMGVLPD